MRSGATIRCLTYKPMLYCAFNVWLVFALPFSLAAHAQSAKDYPNRPVRIIVPQAAGSGVDLTARTVAQKLTDAWSHQFIVDNRPGANGIIGLEAGAKAKPDGYTLSLGVPSSLTMNPYVYKTLPYDTLRDFAPITQTATNTFGLVINPALPVRSVKDLVALAKARPGELSFASFGIGNQTHLGGELFSSQIGIRLLHVPYKGETPAVIDLLSGQTAMIFTPMQGVVPHIRAGKLRLLATLGTTRARAFPDAPSMTEAGFKTVVITGWTGLLAPTGTPPDIIDKLQKEIAARLLVPETRDSLSNQGAEPVASTPEQFAAFIRAEMAKWSAVIKQAGLEATQ
jgi:tripartite-type tricarboxylate transporter receptor subunit TctC